MVTVQILHIRPWLIRPGSREKQRYLKKISEDPVIALRQ